MLFGVITRWINVRGVKLRVLEKLHPYFHLLQPLPFNDILLLFVNEKIWPKHHSFIAFGYFFVNFEDPPFYYTPPFLAFLSEYLDPPILIRHPLQLCDGEYLAQPYCEGIFSKLCLGIFGAVHLIFLLAVCSPLRGKGFYSVHH